LDRKNMDFETLSVILHSGMIAANIFYISYRPHRDLHNQETLIISSENLI
jgi:hypothetical protein